MCEPMIAVFLSEAQHAGKSDAYVQVWSDDDMDSEEEDLLVLGGEGFTPEELAHAEQNFTNLFVSHCWSALSY